MAADCAAIEIGPVYNQVDRAAGAKRRKPVAPILPMVAENSSACHGRSPLMAKKVAIVWSSLVAFKFAPCAVPWPRP